MPESENSNLKDLEKTVNDLLTLHSKDLLQNDEKFKILLESIPALILAFDNNKNLFYANSYLESVTGYSLMDIYHNGFISKIHPDDKTEFTALVEDESITQKITEFRIINKNNKTEWLRAFPNKFEYKKGITGILLVLFKITDIKKREEEVRYASYYKIFFEENPDIAIVHDINGSIFEANLTAVKKLNYPKEELQKRNISDFNITINFDLFKDKNIISDESKIGLLSTLRTKAGKILSGKYQHYLLENTDPQKYLTTFREALTTSIDKERGDTFEIAFGHILRHLNSGFILFNSAGYITHISSNCENLSGVENSAFNESVPYIENLMPPEDYALFQENINTAFKDNLPLTQNITFLNKNGNGKNVIVTILPIINKDENNLILILKENENQPNEEITDFYRMLVNSAPVGIITFNREGFYTSVNEEFLKMIAYSASKDDIMKWNIHNLMDKDKVLPGFVQALEGETIGYVRDYMPSPNEQKFSFYQVFAPLRNANDEIFGVLGMLNEITDRSIIPQNFIESEERSRKIFENIQDVCIIHNSSGKIMTFNPKSVEILGYQYDELPLLNFYDLFQEKVSEKVEDYIYEIQSFGNGSIETSLVKKDKTPINVHITGKVIEVAGLHNFIEFIRII